MISSYGNRIGAPYSRFGGGMTGMGNFGSYGGYPGYGGYRPGIGYGDPNSLGQRMESGTMATFQLLESIVGTFGGFAQMLESTFMATHSSFYAMLVSISLAYSANLNNHRALQNNSDI